MAEQLHGEALALTLQQAGVVIFNQIEAARFEQAALADSALAFPGHTLAGLRASLPAARLIGRSNNHCPEMFSQMF